MGQDTSIHKQYLSPNMSWVGPNGEIPLMAKTEGQDLMISGFISREYGIGWGLSEKNLQN